MNEPLGRLEHELRAMRPRPLSDDMQGYLDRLTRTRRRPWRAAALAGALAAGLVAVMISWSLGRFRPAEVPLQSSLQESTRSVPVTKSPRPPEAGSLETREPGLTELFGEEKLTVYGPMFGQSDVALSEASTATNRRPVHSWMAWQELADEFEAEDGRSARMTAVGPVVLEPGEEFNWN